MSEIDLPFSLNAKSVLRDLEIQRCERSLVYFIRRAWHVLEPSQPYVHNWHIDMIAEHLEAISAGVEVNGRPYNRLLINIPPGGMKSLILNVFFPAWEWGPRNMPHLRYLCAAHKVENLAARDAYKMRMLVTSAWYQKRWGDRVRITRDQSAKLNFANEATGFRVATAIGSLTGIRADRVFIDDPHSVESAASDTMMTSEVTNFREAIPTRLNDPSRSAIVVIMQRLHEADISGVILDEVNKKTPGLWDHIMIPMRFDPRRAGPTLLGTADPREDDGELFFPDRFPVDVVNRDEASLGPYGSAAQFQQEPAPRGGGIIKDEWWKLWPHEKYPPLDFVCASLDTAYTTKEENDYSAMTIWGVFSTVRHAVTRPFTGRYDPTEPEPREYATSAPTVIMLYAWQKRLEFPDLVETVSKDCKRFAVDMLLVESKAAGISLAQELRRAVGHEAFGVQLIDPKGGDKVSRLYSVQHLFSEGMIYAPDKEWAEMVIAQIRNFPKGKHDDLCFVAGTKIATKRGSIPIEDVTTDDYALTPIGWKRVAASGITGCKPVIERHGLTGTRNHPVFTFDLQYQPLVAISSKSKLAGLGLCDLMKTARQRKSFSKGLSIDEWAESADITSANLAAMREGDAQKGFMSRYGNVTTVEMFRHCMKYIIETITCLILSLRIWSAYRVACIAQWLRSTLTGSLFTPIWRRLANWLRRGTGQTKDENGIGAFLRKVLLRPELSSLSSREVMIAPLLGISLVPTAARTLSSEISGGSFVPLGVRTLRQDLSPVYNLTVDGAHCYYANGILVHNCDTVSQALRFLRDSGMLSRAPERISEVGESMRHISRSATLPLYPTA